MKADYQNEKFNEEWKNNLEDMAGLSFATLKNKDAAWEKLHARLHKKPRHKVYAWYWFAAACILIAAMITLFTIHKSTPGIAQHITVTHTEKKSAVKKDEPIKKVTTEKIILQTRRQLQKNLGIQNYSKQLATVNTSVAISPVINSNKALQTQPIIAPMTIDTNATAATSIKIPQKKLKVVHINELGEPVEFPADVAHHTDLHLFQLKLAQQEIYNASSIVSSNSSFLSLKPKNFPK